MGCSKYFIGYGDVKLSTSPETPISDLLCSTQPEVTAGRTDRWALAL